MYQISTMAVLFPFIIYRVLIKNIQPFSPYLRENREKSGKNEYILV